MGVVLPFTLRGLTWMPRMILASASHFPSGQPYIRMARGRPASRRIPSPPECLPRTISWRVAVGRMARAIPSDWQPKGIELLEVRQLYDCSVRMALLNHLGSTSASLRRRAELLNRSMNAAARLRVELYYSNKPTRAQVEAAIQPVQAASQKLAQSLSNLDHESRSLIGRSADEDTVMNDRCGFETPRMRLPVTIRGDVQWIENSLGRERLDAVARTLDDLERWVVAALAEAKSQEDMARGHRKEAIRAAIRDLEKVWVDAWRQRDRENPTLLYFGPFVRTVLNPILAEDGKTQDLTKAIEDVLYRG